MSTLSPLNVDLNATRILLACVMIKLAQPEGRSDDHANVWLEQVRDLASRIMANANYPSSADAVAYGQAISASIDEFLNALHFES